MNNEKIAAVVVTYNRKKLLEECLTSLIGNSPLLNCIIVIDNASNDGTENMMREVFLKNQIFDYIKLSKNIGGAGGFNNGIKRGYERGYDWLWILDDDCIVQKDSLFQMIEAKNFLINHGEDVGFIASNVFWTDGNLCKMNIGSIKNSGDEFKYLDHGIIELDHASFVSILISRESVSRFGLPIKEFFIWLDDYEYTKRITKEKKGYITGYSKVIHKTKKNICVDYSKLSSNELWKYKIEIRNYIFLLKIGAIRKQGICKLLKNYRKILFSQNAKYFIILLFWSIKGLIFNPTIERLK